jgi:hypothetical protein
MAIGEIELPNEDDEWWSYCADGILKYRWATCDKTKIGRMS